MVTPGRLLVCALILTTAHAASADTYMAEPSETRLHERVWLPFGLLDRMRLAPFHMSVSTELGTQDGGDVASVTLHAQMSTACSCNTGIYATLPASIGLTNNARRDSALGTRGTTLPEAQRDPQTQLGTMDIGLFGGSGNRRESWIYRVGALLPTGARELHATLPSARVGDRVLELPRSAGARLSTSKIFGWDTLPRMCSDLFAAFRIDAGVDLASVLAMPGNPVHVIPRAGAGMLISRDGNWTYSVDTALSIDPFVDAGLDLRWSSGVTLRHARADGRNSIVQPALTLATVRTADGWSANLMLDITASMPEHSGDYD